MVARVLRDLGSSRVGSMHQIRDDISDVLFPRQVRMGWRIIIPRDPSPRPSCLDCRTEAPLLRVGIIVARWDFHDGSASVNAFGSIPSEGKRRDIHLTARLLFFPFFFPLCCFASALSRRRKPKRRCFSLRASFGTNEKFCLHRFRPNWSRNEWE